MSAIPASPLRLLLVIDELASLQAGHDTSVAIMEAAQVRGHRISVTTVRDLMIASGRAQAACRDVTVVPARLDQGRWIAADPWYTAAEAVPVQLDDFDAIFMRTDPPVDATYLRATYILDLVDQRSTLMMNDPAGLRHANEKLFGLRLPELGPATVVAADPKTIVETVQSWGRAVLKPTDAMAGRGVLVLDPEDVNLWSIVETATERGAVHVVVQQWVDAAVDGDRRVIVLGGEPLGSVRRVALGDDFRCNMAAGAVTVKDDVTDVDRAICASLAPHLAEHGLHFVGIDVIGDRLTEINVTSPTGVREIDALSGSDLAGDIVSWVEQRCSTLAGADAR
ncbi:glutathione synthetase [Aeromicrobium sp. Root495]|uniref:glutathione synthase n=1 Tax=Aeromicrobium sp. Root495 TaxID=1736550 RepID=UPI000701A135|nr:glutathione synthase [Aeromicrobium sp. Root495]KQY55706.1 glutathione synthetase [Aeromicrobium sp. Root495]